MAYDGAWHSSGKQLGETGTLLGKLEGRQWGLLEKVKLQEKGTQNQETGLGKDKCYQLDGGRNNSLNNAVRNREG